MNTSSWRSRIIEFTVTVVVVALGLQFAVHVIESILPKLILIASIVGVIFLTTLAIRYRRSQW